MITTTESTKTVEMAFKEWTTQALMEKFGLQQILVCEKLEYWLGMDVKIGAETQALLEELRENAIIKVPYWNEDELKFNLIYPLIQMAEIKSKNYNIFLERTISATFDNEYKLLGKPDLIVASGIFEPKNPYFFFHEYKKEKGSADDPIGQLLSAMMVGQKLNDNQKPVYGAYVVGRNWFFVVLEGKNYCISNNFSVTQKDELEGIYRNLVGIKEIIEEELM
ncbi:MAG: hypothetical protein R2799_16275 [Crocinitomicaceae bacterium]